MYAIMDNGAGFRAVDSSADLLEGESFYDSQVPPPPFHRVGADGTPALVVGALAASLMTDLRARRNAALNVLDGLQGDALADGDTKTAAALKAAKQACRDLPDLDIASAPDEASLRALYANRWKEITRMVPAAVRPVFASVLV